eukprot:g6499.t1
MKEKNIKMNTGTYNHMIHVVGEVGRDVDGARRLFAEMKEKNIEMDARTYNAMIRVVGDVNGDVDGARRLFAEMKEKNIEMNAGTYSLMNRVVGDVDGDVHSETKEEFDVLVVGGGATGSGAALDAQLRGLKTCLIERGDFANETSSRSTKLVWAGIRYIGTATGQLLRLKNLRRPLAAFREFWEEFTMVLGAHRERKFLLETQAHLTKWVPIAVPIKDWVIQPAPMGHPLFSLIPFVLPVVMRFYDSLGKFCSPPSHLMSRSRALRKFPQLAQDCKYVQVFYEGQHNDARTNVAIALTAAEKGATVTNYVEMTGLIFEDGKSGGKAIGVKCRDHISDDDYELYSKAIIFAGGAVH